MIEKVRSVATGAAMLVLTALLLSVPAGCTAETDTKASRASTTVLTSTGVTAPTVSSASTTPTTLGPGQMTFDTLTMRFETLVEREDLIGTLPYSEMAADELAWLSDEVAQIAITDARGYRFANGDLVVLFFVEPVMGADQDAAWHGLDAVAQERYAEGDRRVWTMADGDFGFVVVSRDYWSDLGRMAQWARAAP
jgi:hypothetical protein